MQDGEKEFRVAEAIARQIELEQGLVSSRLTWNLTFQGFMMASYALVAAADATAPARQLIQGTICFAGIIVAAASLLGVLAASRQSNYLRAHWDRVLGADTLYPRPFSVGSGRLSGRLPPRALCVVLIVMWLILMVAGWGLMPA